MVCVVEDSGDCYRVMYFVALVESLKVSSAGIAFVDSTTNGFINIVYLPIVQLGGKLLSAGFMVLRFI